MFWQPLADTSVWHIASRFSFFFPFSLLLPVWQYAVQNMSPSQVLNNLFVSQIIGLMLMPLTEESLKSASKLRVGQICPVVELSEHANIINIQYQESFC